MQVLELLAKETALLRDRQLLAREVEFLRGQIMPVPNASDMDKLFTVNHNIIDDILDSVKSDEYKTKQDLDHVHNDLDTAADGNSLVDQDNP